MKFQKFYIARKRLRSVRRGCPRGAALAGAVLAAMAVVAGPGPVTAQQAATLNGPPVQVRPYVSEPGVPQITINPGTPSPFPSDTGGAGTGGGGTGGGGNVGSSDALNTMMGMAWGNTAVANAESLGVNPSALAATCVLELGLSERRRFGHCRRRFSDDGIDLHCDDQRGGRTEPVTGGPDCAWPRGANGPGHRIDCRLTVFDQRRAGAPKRWGVQPYRSRYQRLLQLWPKRRGSRHGRRRPVDGSSDAKCFSTSVPEQRDHSW